MKLIPIESLYDGLLQQFRELGVTSDAQSNNVSVIDKAELPGSPGVAVASPQSLFGRLP